MRKARGLKGFTLLEVVIAFTIFSIALTVLAFTLSTSRQLLAETSGSADATLKLRKIYLALEEDLRSSAFTQTGVVDSLISPGGGLTGDAFWFLSSQDPATERRARGEDGAPLWQRNLLYYPAIPTNHDALYGMSCSGGPSADGYDGTCPHKVLVRKVIDTGAVTTPTDPSTEEFLLTPTDISSYLTNPTGFNVPTTGPGTEETHIVAPSILTFRVERAPESSRWPSELRFHLQVTALEELGKRVALGSANLEQAPQTESMEFSIFPENP